MRLELRTSYGFKIKVHPMHELQMKGELMGAGKGSGS